ncbi:ap-4 complex subunit beta-1 [Anaeramoeba flamelloides]|uniref:Ap-4 complex subunit beta-1 n=1 Tax=Anaeramoeba flamelloides TaxID=1746091 RepID=A0AAV7YDH1_9EUKA|nr:ap-4 complex subunit beta-1 [Anaeramoeba flamelloides]
MDEIFKLFIKQLKSNNKETKLETVQKIVNLTVKGYDLYSLLPQIIVSMGDFNDCHKYDKLVYTLLRERPDKYEDFLILMWGTLTKNSKSQHALKRVVSIRTMASICTEHTLEYFFTLFRNYLNDKTSVVRNACLMAYFELVDRFTFLVGDLHHFLVIQNLVFDSDPRVAINAICVLFSILQKKSTVLLQERIILHFLSKIDTLHPFGKYVIFKLCSKYKPHDLDQANLILKICLKHLSFSNSGILLQITDIFLHYSQTFPQLTKDAFYKITKKIITSLKCSTKECKYPILQHILLLIKNNYNNFEDYCVDFYLNHDDAIYNQKIKIKILAEICSLKNYEIVLKQLLNYLYWNNLKLNMRIYIIKKIKKISYKLRSVNRYLYPKLIDVVDNTIPDISVRSLLIVKDLLRFDSNLVITPFTCRVSILFNNQHVANTKKHLIWIIGKYYSKIENVDQMLKVLVKNFFQEKNTNIQLEIVNTLVKCYLMSPEKYKIILPNIFSKILNNCGDIDLRERVFFYSKILNYNVQAAKQIIFPKIITKYQHKKKLDLYNYLYQNFNTLSVCYMKPFDYFNNYSNLNKESEESDIDLYDDNNNNNNNNKINYFNYFTDSGSDSGSGSSSGSDSGSESGPNLEGEYEKISNNSSKLNNQQKKSGNNIKMNLNNISFERDYYYDNANNLLEREGDDDEEYFQNHDSQLFYDLNLLNIIPKQKILLNKENYLTLKQFKKIWFKDLFINVIHITLCKSYNLNSVQNLLNQNNIHVLSSKMHLKEMQLLCSSIELKTENYILLQMSISNNNLKCTLKSNDDLFLSKFEFFFNNIFKTNK